jgi:hypothetical protein
MHGHAHKRLGETMDLSSAFEIGPDDFDPNHRHLLEQSWGLYSEILVAKIAVLDNVDALDAELDEPVTRSITV